MNLDDVIVELAKLKLKNPDCDMDPMAIIKCLISYIEKLEIYKWDKTSITDQD